MEVINYQKCELNLPHLGCVGHTLKLGIGKAFCIDAVAHVLGRVRRLVGHFHKSSKVYALRDKQVYLSCIR